MVDVHPATSLVNAKPSASQSTARAVKGTETKTASRHRNKAPLPAIGWKLRKLRENVETSWVGANHPVEKMRVKEII